MQLSWRATLVDEGGGEHDYPLGSLPRGYRGFAFTMMGFDQLDPGRRDAICRTWVAGAPELVGRSAQQVRVYLERRPLSNRDGERARPGERELRWLCDGEGAERVG